MEPWNWKQMLWTVGFLSVTYLPLQCVVLWKSRGATRVAAALPLACSTNHEETLMTHSRKTLTLLMALASLCGCSQNAPLPATNGSTATTEVTNSMEKPTSFTEQVASFGDPKRSIEEAGIPKSAADHERIQGRWDYVTLTTGPRDSIVFAKDTITFDVRDKTATGTFDLDSTTQPKRIDLKYVGGADAPEFSQGIYQFQNDLLLICFATSPGIRPTEFKSTDKQNVFMLVRPTKERIRP